MSIRSKSLTAAIVFALLGGFALGDDATEPTAEDRAAHLARMKKVAESFHVFGTADRSQPEVKLVADPILRYVDSTRKTFDSTMWLVGERGRPTALIAIEYYPKHPRGPLWLYELASLSGERIAARRGAELDWTAREPGLAFKDLPDAPEVADKAVARLSQIRQMQRRFTAHEDTPVEGRIELRPLTKPLHRYDDASAGILDGAIVSFANGTNPEVLLVLEAQGRRGDPAVWKYALVQLTGGVVEAELDGKSVWNRGEADPPTVRDNYVNGWLVPDRE